MTAYNIGDIYLNMYNTLYVLNKQLLLMQLDIDIIVSDYRYSSCSQ